MVLPGLTQIQTKHVCDICYRKRAAFLKNHLSKIFKIALLATEGQCKPPTTIFYLSNLVFHHFYVHKTHDRNLLSPRIITNRQTGSKTSWEYKKMRTGLANSLTCRREENFFDRYGRYFKASYVSFDVYVYVRHEQTGSKTWWDYKKMGTELINALTCRPGEKVFDS